MRRALPYFCCVWLPWPGLCTPRCSWCALRSPRLLRQASESSGSGSSCLAPSAHGNPDFDFITGALNSRNCALPWIRFDRLTFPSLCHLVLVDVREIQFCKGPWGIPTDHGRFWSGRHKRTCKGVVHDVHGTYLRVQIIAKKPGITTM